MLGHWLRFPSAPVGRIPDVSGAQLPAWTLEQTKGARYGLLASFACQPWSQYGDTRGLRGSLIGVLRLLLHTNPAFVLLENVYQRFQDPDQNCCSSCIQRPSNGDFIYATKLAPRELRHQRSLRADPRRLVEQLYVSKVHRLQAAGTSSVLHRSAAQISDRCRQASRLQPTKGQLRPSCGALRLALFCRFLWPVAVCLDPCSRMVLVLPGLLS